MYSNINITKTLFGKSVEGTKNQHHYGNNEQNKYVTNEPCTRCQSKEAYCDEPCYAMDIFLLMS
jgi:hypothetical protein